MHRRDPLALKVLIAFVVGGIVLLAAAWFTLSSGADYLEGDERVDRLNAARLAVSRVLGTVKDAETGQRGYVITGREEYLAPYRQAVAALDSRLHDARLALAAVNASTSNLDEISVRATRTLSEIEKTIVARQTQGFAAAQRMIATDALKIDVDRIRALVQTIVASLDADQIIEVAQTRERHRHTVTGVWLLGAICGLLFVASYMVIAWEISRRHQITGELEQKANHDLLTQLPNRRFFDDWLGYALAQARRDSTHLGLLFIDIDGFKAINDRHGHKVGDTVLSEIARRFRDVSRQSDLLARLGGDEFALVAPNARDSHELTQIGQRLINSLTNSKLPPLSDVAIGASIGVALFPDDASDVRVLVAVADDAMYAAKRAGKNRIMFHQAALAAAPVVAVTSPRAA